MLKNYKTRYFTQNKETEQLLNDFCAPGDMLHRKFCQIMSTGKVATDHLWSKACVDSQDTALHSPSNGKISVK